MRGPPVNYQKKHSNLTNTKRRDNGIFSADFITKLLEHRREIELIVQQRNKQKKLQTHHQEQLYEAITNKQKKINRKQQELIDNIHINQQEILKEGLKRIRPCLETWET